MVNISGAEGRDWPELQGGSETFHLEQDSYSRDRERAKHVWEYLRYETEQSIDMEYEAEAEKG